MPTGVRARVLVIDDEPNVRAFVCDLLEGLGYEADDAEDGRQGLALLERDRYDLVITDLQMPNGSGWGCGERSSSTSADGADDHDLRLRDR